MNDTSPWNPDSFWDLIASCGRNLRTLSRKLEQFSKLDLCRYHVAFEDWKSDVSPHNWEECHPYLERPCSEDHADDFAAWVVMQGEAFYAEVAGHPGRIQHYLEMFSDCRAGGEHAEMRWDTEVERDEYRGSRRADFIASAVYRARFGGSILDACYDSRGWPREGLE